MLNGAEYLQAIASGSTLLLLCGKLLGPSGFVVVAKEGILPANSYRIQNEELKYPKSRILLLVTIVKIGGVMLAFHHCDQRRHVLLMN